MTDTTNQITARLVASQNKKPRPQGEGVAASLARQERLAMPLRGTRR
jgi:hypothetical protein